MERCNKIIPDLFLLTYGETHKTVPVATNIQSLSNKLGVTGSNLKRV